MDIKLCTQCGAVIDSPTQKFCANCGKSIQEIQAVPPKKDSGSSETSIAFLLGSTMRSILWWPFLPSRKPIEHIPAIISRNQGKLIVFGGIIALFLISILLTPNHFKDGMSDLEDRQWDQAIESFTKVGTNSKDYFEAHQGITLAKAHKIFQSNKWAETIVALGHFGYSDSTMQRYAAILKDSAQFHMTVDTLTVLMPRLRTLITENTNRDSVKQMFAAIGAQEHYTKFVRSHYPNGDLIISFSRRLCDAAELHGKEDKDLLAKSENISSEIEIRRDKLSTIKSERIHWKTFTINKLFDQAESEYSHESKGVYSGLSMSEYSEVVVVASEDEIPTNPYARMNLTLLVKSLGNKRYIKGNGYGYSTNVYAPTYETVGKDMDPNAVAKEILRLQKEKNSMASAVAALKNKAKLEMDNIVTEAIGALSKSNWQ